jgi:hypothetical protein
MINNRLNSLEMNLRNKEEKVMLMKVQLKNLNNGTSTGQNWIDGLETITSYSPVDGKIIGNVTN